jgi:mRNA interferase MazF
MEDEEIKNSKYIKDFTTWHEIKSATDKRDTRRILLKEGAVWLIRLGVNVGSELDGKGIEFFRPVIVIKKINEQVFFGVPVSSRINKDYFRQEFILLGKPRDAVLSHVRAFDKKRCMRFMTMLDKNTKDVITQRIGHMFLEDETPNIAGMSGESRLPFGANVDSVADDELNAS